MTQLVLGGIPVTLYSGAPDVRYSDAGGRTDVTLSGGKPIAMRHFSKRVITITGTGWMATGLDALDWDAEHVLLSPSPLRLSGAGTAFTLTADPRPDEAVTAQALVGGRWVNASVTATGRAATVTPVTGATLYTVAWFPQFTVLCTPPDEGYAGGAVDWQITCREV
ncbi:hypothetical protein SAMN05216421_1113 [Halopseudomonas xinjiangensis]|uniref:Uncharacterized protein n=1 Tax=Halopseudomonas xinjiangensis TaxID=487184 RepID=A0A1H1QDG4_9GAMM|nr:hypothetical protein [Halopseudomonas xinjiangensis]SDS21532.1 hypothetical protein SAMN05216421_1113 [Halopseudomonas xinjiangensis]